ncbi:beta-propeller fold lactonase family protein [Rhizomonospora bruguierae]|uniref:beta-propeller fold lactonase family protein n=1 Tax=Rhizomonospora bruguierae TaxID=1581705 RepID=UPI001BD0FE7A|nr:beta-propeller fold lactonase family protein [Micromonospora sp. NBRC 107566]
MPTFAIRRHIVLPAVTGLLIAGVAVVSDSAGAGAASAMGTDRLYVTNSALRAEPEAADVTWFRLGPGGTVTSTGTAPAGHGARGIVFSARLAPNGQRFGYVSSQLVNEIERYRVNPDGSLTFAGATPTPQPFGIATDPRAHTVYVANFDGGHGTGVLSAFHIESTGALTLLNTVDSGGVNAKGVAVTPDGRFVYAVHGAQANEPAVVTGFVVRPDGSIGARVAEAGLGSSGHRIVITPDGRFAYITNQEAGDDPDIFGFRIGARGELTPISPEPVESGVWTEGAAISPDGHRLYVTALGVVGGTPPATDGQVRGFDIGADGRLTQVDRIDIGFDPVDLAFGAGGTRVYIADFSGNSVTVFAVDRRGHLQPTRTVSSQGSGPGYQAVAVL